MPEPEAELQATANLSPVSPSPVHTAAPQVVPALQDTVDTLDAMVAAAAAAAAAVDAPQSGAMEDPEPTMNPTANGSNGDTVDDDGDDDSFDDAYGEDTVDQVVPTGTTATEGMQPQQSEDNDDDYAKMFDSPINPEEDEPEAAPQEAREQQQQSHVPSVPAESNNSTLPSTSLNTRHEDSAIAASETSAAMTDPAESTVGRPQATKEVLAADPSYLPDAQPAPRPLAQPDALQSTPAQTAPGHQTSSSPDIQAGGIQQLVAQLAAQPPESSANPDASDLPEKSEPAPSSSNLPSVVPSSTLPPRPPQPQSGPQTHASQHHPTGATTPGGMGSLLTPPVSAKPSHYSAPGASGSTLSDAVGASLPPTPATGLGHSLVMNPMNAPAYGAQPPAYQNPPGHDAGYEHAWNQFVADERQYMSEAKWDRFPEGSRIFIGNLSSDKVSKKEVFDLFHKFGRLAQISLKSAYGFVQYHAADEGRQALEALQDAEVKGRKIHLEVSRVQDKSKKERIRSPDRGRGHDGRRSDRQSHGRDDYRPGRNHSPRRNDYPGRDEGHGRDRGHLDSRRSSRRSRSPSYGRNSKDHYRRRSPSPYGRSRSEPELDLPRRYGADVPDVQIILQSDVNRDFVSWVEGTLKAKGLRTEVMFLHPRFPKDQVIQRQAAEGVHAVVDLDLRAQHMGRIPVQAFDRSAGSSNVRFDQYVDLDPTTAAEVILRAKASGAPSYGQSYGAPSGYPNQYGVAPQPQQQQQAPPPAPSHYAGAQQPAAYQPPPQSNVPDIAGLIGHVDNATLQKLLSNMQGPPQGAVPGMPVAHNAPAQPAAPQVNTQVDIQALLGSLGGGGGAVAPQQPSGPSQGHYGAQYGGAMPPNGAQGHPSQGGGGDSAAQVQNIMAQLSRFR